jgi:hypothetical protein
MSTNDNEYQRQPAVDERAMAFKSDRYEVAAIYEELARQYQASVEWSELRPALGMAFPRQVAAQPLAGRETKANATLSR